MGEGADSTLKYSLEETNTIGRRVSNKQTNTLALTKTDSLHLFEYIQVRIEEWEGFCSPFYHKVLARRERLNKRAKSVASRVSKLGYGETLAIWAILKPPTRTLSFTC